MIVRSSSTHRTELCIVGCRNNLITVDLKVGDKRLRLCYLKADGQFCRIRFSSFCPVHKMEPCGWCSCQSAISEMLICASTSHCATSCRIGNCCNLICVDGKVGDIIACSAHLKLISGRSGNLNTSLCPVHKVISRGGGGNQGTGPKMIVCPGSCHRTELCIVGDSTNLISVDLKICDKRLRLCYLKADSRFCRRHLFTLCPIHKVITSSWSCRQGACSEMIIGTCSCDGTTSSRVSGSRNCITINFKICDIVASTSDFKLICGISRNY